MKKTIILMLMLVTAAYGQQRNARTEVTLPAPGATGTVTLALAEYNRLVELASHKPKTPEAAPLPFVLSRAAFKLRVEDQSLIGAVDIDGSVLEKGSVAVPLTSGLTILEAKQSGNALPLLQEGPRHAAILNGPGPFSVSLDIASALTVEAGRASFIVPVPPASSSLLTLDLPGNHANVRIEPGLITSRTTDNGHTIVEATLEPGKPARVWWTTREIAAPVSQREVRFLSDIKSVVFVGDSQLRITALCDATVIQGDAADYGAWMCVKSARSPNHWRAFRCKPRFVTTVARETRRNFNSNGHSFQTVRCSQPWWSAPRSRRSRTSKGSL